MKTKSMYAVCALAVAILSASAVVAQEAKIPTGIDVPGCARYVLVEGRVVQICDNDTNPTRLINTRDAQSRLNNGGDGSSGGNGGDAGAAK